MDRLSMLSMLSIVHSLSKQSPNTWFPVHTPECTKRRISKLDKPNALSIFSKPPTPTPVEGVLRILRAHFLDQFLDQDRLTIRKHTQEPAPLFIKPQVASSAYPPGRGSSENIESAYWGVRTKTCSPAELDHCFSVQS